MHAKTRGRRSLALVVLTLAATVLLPSLPADARESQHTPRSPGTVTLDATPTIVDHGQAVALSGAISPPAPGETVDIKTGGGVTVASAATDAGGAYATSFHPDSNVTLHAEWGPDSSAPVDVKVRAVVTIKLREVRLFGRAKVTGTVEPATPGAPVSVDFVRKGAGVIESGTVDQRAGGAFVWRTSAIEQPDDYQAKATAGGPGLEDGTATTPFRDTPLPSLHPGSHGPAVRLLEKRLSGLGYHFFGINEGYDQRTGDAVMAFRKVQGMTRTNTVNAAVWRKLADPRIPQPKQKTKLRHLEVDWSKQVMYVVEDNEIRWIMHVSTGKPSTPTPFGTFRVYRKYNGYNGLWWPSYIYRGVAIHGWPQVPDYPASHGCVRVPIWHAKWIFGIAKMGTRVMIYV